MDIKEFANRLGLSPTTISHAISGRRYVKEATRKLILEKMHEWGYTPNINAQRMQRNSTNLVAFFSEKDALEDPYQLEVLRTLCTELRTRGYDLILDLANDSEGEDRYLPLQNRIAAHAIDGSIVIGQRLSMEVLRTISTPFSPCIYVDNYNLTHHSCENVGLLMVQNRDAFQEVIVNLAKMGRRDVVFLGRNPDDRVQGEILEMFSQNGVELHDGRVVYSEESEEKARLAMETILKSKRLPQAILARTYAQARGAYSVAREMGIAVPEKLSIISCGDRHHAQLKDLPLSFVAFDFREVARKCVDMLFRIRRNPSEVLPVEIIKTKFFR